MGQSPCCGGDNKVQLVTLEPSRPECEEGFPMEQDPAKWNVPAASPRDCPESAVPPFDVTMWFNDGDIPPVSAEGQGAVDSATAEGENSEGFLGSACEGCNQWRNSVSSEGHAAKADTGLFEIGGGAGVGPDHHGTSPPYLHHGVDPGPDGTSPPYLHHGVDPDPDGNSPRHLHNGISENTDTPMAEAEDAAADRGAALDEVAVDSSTSSSRRQKAGTGTPAKSKKAREAERLARDAAEADSFKATSSSTKTANAESAKVAQKQVADDLFNTLSSNMSNMSVSPFSTLDYEDMPKDQRREARGLIKEFVKAMVRGRHISVVAASGDVRTCFCVLTRHLDRLKISFDESQHKIREVNLSTITEIAVDENPADELLVTLVLDNDQSITFRAKSIEERDKLASCLTMLVGQAKQSGGAKRGR